MPTEVEIHATTSNRFIFRVDRIHRSKFQFETYLEAERAAYFATRDTLVFCRSGNAAALSLLIPGLGQAAKRRHGSAAICVAASCLAWTWSGWLGLSAHALAALHAGHTRRRISQAPLRRIKDTDEPTSPAPGPPTQERLKSVIDSLASPPPEAPHIIQSITSKLGLPIAPWILELNFMSDAVVDSLGSVELICAIEDEFDIDVDDESISRTSTVRDLANVCNHLVTLRTKQ